MGLFYASQCVGATNGVLSHDYRRRGANFDFLLAGILHVDSLRGGIAENESEREKKREREQESLERVECYKVFVFILFFFLNDSLRLVLYTCEIDMHIYIRATVLSKFL